VKDVILKLQPSPEADAGLPAVIRTGEPYFVPVVTDDVLVKMARNDEHLALLRSIGIHSAMIVPIETRGMILGALTLVSSRPERHFDEADLTTAESLGRRAAVAIDNARLYRAARAADEIKRNFLATMSHELRTPLTAIIGFEQLLADGVSGPVSEGQKQPLRRIKACAQQLQSLIEEMFLLARLTVCRCARTHLTRRRHRPGPDDRDRRDQAAADPGEPGIQCREIHEPRRDCHSRPGTR